MQRAKEALGERPGLSYATSAQRALEGATAVIIVTEWKEFRSPDFAHMARTLHKPIVFDGRNLFEPCDMKALGLEYHAIGRPAPAFP